MRLSLQPCQRESCRWQLRVPRHRAGAGIEVSPVLAIQGLVRPPFDDRFEKAPRPVLGRFVRNTEELPEARGRLFGQVLRGRLKKGAAAAHQDFKAGTESPCKNERRAVLSPAGGMSQGRAGDVVGMPHHMAAVGQEDADGFGALVGGWQRTVGEPDGCGRLENGRECALEMVERDARKSRDIGVRVGADVEQGGRGAARSKTPGKPECKGRVGQAGTGSRQRSADVVEDFGGQGGMSGALHDQRLPA